MENNLVKSTSFSNLMTFVMMFNCHIGGGVALDNIYIIYENLNSAIGASHCSYVVHTFCLELRCVIHVMWPSFT